jgi:hypothetical protein
MVRAARAADENKPQGSNGADLKADLELEARYRFVHAIPGTPEVIVLATTASRYLSKSIKGRMASSGV